MGHRHKAFVEALNDALSPERTKRAVLDWVLRSKGVNLNTRQMNRFMKAFVAAEAGKPFPDNLFPEISKDVEITEEDIQLAAVGYGRDLEFKKKDLILEYVLEYAPIEVRNIRRHAKVPLADREASHAAFEKRLQRTWGRGFNALETMLGCVREFSVQLLQDWDQEEAQNPSSLELQELTLVLRDLHMKACRIAAEVLCLLRSGYADGANARWRSLHEIAVIASFIGTHKGDYPQRYRDHAAWERARQAKDYQEHCQRLGEDPYEQSELDEFEAEKRRMVAKHGPQFDQDYGWAAPLFPAGKRGFAAIELVCGMNHWRPYYKMACHAVHAGAQGLNFALGNPKEPTYTLSGSSDLGLMDPAQCTALSLSLATCALFLHRTDLDSLVATEVVRLLGQDVIAEFSKGHAKMEARRSAKNRPEP